MDRLSTKGQMIDQIDLAGVPHSGFDRSNHNYGSGKLGAIIPTRLDEVYPGDRIKGSPTTVANFEPLVAPLMGSMVMKQESFFVPLPQVWKHSYKFFTGKNEFNEQMPSMSPRQIFDVYNEYVFGELFHIGDDTDLSFDSIAKKLASYYEADTTDRTYHDVVESFFFDDIKEISTNLYAMFRTVYNNRKMMDLVLPLYYDVEKFCKSEYIRNLSEEFEKYHTQKEKETLIHDLCAQLGQQMQNILLFFFGPSSLMDYLGWPIVVPKNCQVNIDVYAGTFVPRTIFHQALSKNIFNGYGSDTTLTATIQSLFSAVPLIFLPFKANYLIWYWNYRDQLLETGILDPEEDEFLGSEITVNVVIYCTLMRQRCWFKDAYTTALTNTGDGNLLVPTGYDSNDIDVDFYDNNGNLISTSDKDEALQSGATICQVHSGNYSYKIPMNYLVGAQSGVYGSTGTFTTSFLSLDLFDRVKRLRSVVQKRLILGYEVDDVIWSSFMVRLSNVRMHIPELLGRGRDAVDISTVVNNTSTDQQLAGDKTAIAWAKGSISDVDYFAEEWGFYLQYMTIMPIQSYAGGMQRLYIKRDSLDWMWPEFATMGMDSVYNFELAAFGTHLSDEDGLKVFGYNGRYYDLKYRQDEEHGRLLTDLNYLTFSREFDEVPKLNYMFVHCWPRLDGFVIDSTLEDVFRYDCYTAQGWERRLPVPSSIVH